ncbi:hypothetical protein K8I28_15480 [bacterium]|nr:hypothetical protein [bacterium]
MKKMVKLFAYLTVFTLVSNTFAGIGIHVGMDMTEIDATTSTFAFDSSPASVDLTREASGNPLNVGVDLTLGMIPIIDIQLSVEAAFSNYTIDYASSAPGVTPLEGEEIPFLRAGADLSVLKSIISFPPVVKVVDVFAGAGLSLHAFAPIVNETLIKDNIQSATEAIDPVAYADDIETSFGFHLMLGAKIKPGPVPFGFRVQGKYYMFSGLPEDTPDSFMTVQAGIFFGS